MLKVLDLFSGIGGFSLGLERAGMRTVAFCEIDPYCRAVLKKHWPDVPCFPDVRTLTAESLAAAGIEVDVICGGFPCQDISVAGYRAGLDGERSGLWREYKRLIRELRPLYVIVENTAGLLSLGMGVVLGDLAELGYDAEWQNIPAAFVGADHMRERIWIVAYSNRERELQSQGRKPDKWRRLGYGASEILTHALRAGLSRWCNAGEDQSDAPGFGAWIGFADASAADASGFDGADQPLLGREVHGIPARLDRIKALGNAVVPQIPEIIGRAIIAHHKGEHFQA